MLPNRMQLSRQTEEQLKKTEGLHRDYSERSSPSGIFPISRERISLFAGAG